jgi:uncharacterized protein YdaU (DUF1376 family)
VNLPYFKWYGRDFLLGTARMTAAAKWHYMALLWAQWETGPLPNDIKLLDRISPGVKRFWPEIADKFETRPEGLVNARLERERAEVDEQREVNSRRAKVAAEARHGRRRTEYQNGTLVYSAARSTPPSTAPSDACSNATSMLGACLEHARSSAISEVRSQNTDHPTHSGGGGVEGGGCFADEAAEPPETQTSQLIEAMHPSYAAAKAGFGQELFDRTIAARVSQVTKLLARNGVETPAIIAEAVRSALRWPWDDFSARLNALKTEAASKTSPGGWLVSTLAPRGQRQPLRIA